MALSMALWMALNGRRVSGVASYGVGLEVAAGQSLIDMAIQFLLDEPTATGGRLEFSGKAQVLGAPCPESANALDADARNAADAPAAGKAFQSLK